MPRPLTIHIVGAGITIGPDAANEALTLTLDSHSSENRLRFLPLERPPIPLPHPHNRPVAGSSPAGPTIFLSVHSGHMGCTLFRGHR